MVTEGVWHVVYVCLQLFFGLPLRSSSNLCDDDVWPVCTFSYGCKRSCRGHGGVDMCILMIKWATE